MNLSGVQLTYLFPKSGKRRRSRSFLGPRSLSSNYRVYKRKIAITFLVVEIRGHSFKWMLHCLCVKLLTFHPSIIGLTRPHSTFGRELFTQHIHRVSESTISRQGLQCWVCDPSPFGLRATYLSGSPYSRWGFKWTFRWIIKARYRNPVWPSFLNRSREWAQSNCGPQPWAKRRED